MAKENFLMSVADSLLGPTIDWLGTTTVPTSLTTYYRVDRKTGEVIGEGSEIAGDGLAYMDTYSQRSTLRNQVFGEK